MPSKKSTRSGKKNKTDASAKTSKKSSNSISSDTKKMSRLNKIRPRSPFRGYFVDSWREIKRVKWPTRKEAWKLTLAVIIFAVIFSAFLAGLDYGFAELAKLLFLNS